MLSLPDHNRNSWVRRQGKLVTKGSRTLAILLLPLKLVVLDEVDKDELQDLLRQETPRAGVGAVAKVDGVLGDGAEVELGRVNLLALLYPALGIKRLGVLVDVVVPVEVLVRERELGVGWDMKAVAEGVSGDGGSLHGDYWENQYSL